MLGFVYIAAWLHEGFLTFTGLYQWLLAGLPRRFLALAGLDRRLFAGLLGWLGMASCWAS